MTMLFPTQKFRGSYFCSERQYSVGTSKVVVCFDPERFVLVFIKAVYLDSVRFESLANRE
jgi:hypothetical protein